MTRWDNSSFPDRKCIAWAVRCVSRQFKLPEKGKFKSSFDYTHPDNSTDFRSMTYHSKFIRTKQKNKPA